MHQKGALNRTIYMLIQPKVDLYDRVINQINKEEKMMILKRRLILRSSGLLLSIFAFIPLSFKLFSDIAQSGFSHFFSLLFSDFNIIMANIGDYVLSLLELMPALSLSLFLAALLSALFSIAKLADSYVDFKKISI
jgi:hypothetical protein